jgi:sulfoxide reductase catalytic subunit YedY
MLIKKTTAIRPSEITSKDNYLNRRDFIRAGSIAGAAALAGPALGAVVPDARRAKLADVASSEFSTIEAPNSYEHVTEYNNFYEFGTGKDDPARNAQDFDPLPWSITVDGHAGKTGTFHFEDFIKPFDLEERIYRMRCVEAWSMVIPWVGISLADVVKHYQPTSKAKFERPRAHARPEPSRSRLAVPRRSHNRGSNQPASDSRRRRFRRNDAESERGTDTFGRALEIRLQRHQEHRAH